jgi:Rrf2 family transcriptional regulator, cysteine metabolism repressor
VKLSSKCEYACLALIYLAEHFGNEASGHLSKIQEIADTKHIPKKFLEQILIVLKQRGYVKSKQGANGGYRLALPPDKVTLAEIIRLMDGALAPVESVSKYFYEPTPIEQEKKLLEVFRGIRDHIATRLESITFQDLVPGRDLPFRPRGPGKR